MRLEHPRDDAQAIEPEVERASGGFRGRGMAVIARDRGGSSRRVGRVRRLHSSDSL